MSTVDKLLGDLKTNPLDALYDLVDLARTEEGRRDIGCKGIHSIVEVCSVSKDEEIVESGTRALINLAFDLGSFLFYHRLLIRY